MNGNVFILCSGEQTRFDSDTPKQLLHIKNTPILKHTIEQVKSCNCNPVIVTHNKEIIDFCNSNKINTLIPDNHEKTVITLLSTSTFWNSRVIVLLGDVYYQPRCIKTIFDCKNPMCTIGNGIEIFGLSFLPCQRIINALVKASVHKDGKLWQFYRAYCGIPLDVHGRDKYGFYHVVKDGTDDIDTQEEYQLLKDKIENST